MNYFYNSLLVDYLNFNIICEFIRQKYYLLSFRKNVNIYNKAFNIYFALKIIRNKLFNTFQLFFILIYNQKNLFDGFYNKTLIFIN